jgi:hypothetical protein
MKDVNHVVENPECPGKPLLVRHMAKNPANPF